LDDGYVKYYANIFEGFWENHDPFAAGHRIFVHELPSPNVCTVFRSYQGWLAVTKQGKGDGTLQLVPLVKEAITYILLRPFVEKNELGVWVENNNFSDDPLCNAFDGKQLQLIEKYHKEILQGLISIPVVEPGDTVWWHPDLIHAVEKVHGGSHNSSVFYIGAVPLCKPNAEYLVKQRKSFLTGEASPDFPQEGAELHYKDRAITEDLTELGKMQMGFTPWCSSASDTSGIKELISECASIIQSSS